MPVAAIMTGYGIQLHPYTRAWIAAMTVAPSAAAAKVYDNFVWALVTGNVWDSMDIISGCPTHDEQSSIINVINPGYADFLKVATSGAGPIFTAKDGWDVPTGDGYLHSAGVNMNTLAKYQATNAHFGIFTKTNSTGTQIDVGAPTLSNQSAMNPRDAGGNAQIRINFSGTAWPISGQTDSSGHNLVTLTGTNDMRYYKNGVLVATNLSSVARSVATVPFGMLAVVGAQSRRKNTIAHCGAHLTDTQAAALSAAINQFVTQAAAL